MDKRHRRRIKIVQELYAFLINRRTIQLSQTSRQIIEKTKTIDQKIQKAAVRYALSKIAKVDLAILRLSIYELTVEKKQPPKVIINEAVELAKELAGDKSPGFVNAVLGKVYEELE